MTRQLSEAVPVLPRRREDLARVVDLLNGDRAPGALAFGDPEIGITALPILVDHKAAVAPFRLVAVKINDDEVIGHQGLIGWLFENERDHLSAPLTQKKLSG